ncbi:MAG: DUF4231 domain-containing protein [Pseudomonadota bacterium]
MAEIQAEGGGGAKPESIAAYVTGRVDDQIGHFAKAATREQSRGKGWQNAVIVATAFTPLLIGLAEIMEGMSGTKPFYYLDPKLLRGAALVSSFLAVVASTLLSTRRYWENGVLYRAREQALIREKWLWEQRAGPYAETSDPERDRLLTERVEALIEEDVTGWTGRMRAASKNMKT